MGMQMGNPFHKGERKRPPPVEVSGREWARLYVMTLVLFIAVGVMIYIKASGDSAKKPKLNDVEEGIGYTIRNPIENDAPPPPTAPVVPPEGDTPATFRELAAPFKDGEGMPVKETPEFLRVMNAFMKPEVREKLRAELKPELTVDVVFQDPDRNRGQAVRSYGRLIYIYTERLDATTPQDVKFVYLGVMQEYRTNRTVMFYMAEKPTDPATGEPIRFTTRRRGGQEFYEDWVEVEGIFLRRCAYPSQFEDEKGRTKWAQAAVLFVKDLRLSRPPEFARLSTPMVVIIIGGITLLVAVGVIMAGVMSRKYSSGSLRMKMVELKRQRKEGGGSSPEAPSAPPAPPPPPPAPGEGGSPPS